ncbi:MAG: hypothetical protein M1822_007529 [Bathelium mastoideum]|nr:MAG: hypothetical protein M1822_007529 [Bathelium mastoideum]
MVLVGYSDSEGSDTEPIPRAQPAAQPSSTSSKPTFRKVVDRSNPHKIKVNLPVNDETGDGDIAQEAPPAKKPRVGGGAFSGFNSFLPAPKKTAGNPGAVNSSSKGGIGKGLGKGVSLKTGATPGFSRDAIPGPGIGQDEGTAEEAESYNDLGEVAASSTNLDSLKASAKDPSAAEVESVRKPTMFRPLSVARNAQKKPKKPTIPHSKPANGAPPSVATAASTIASDAPAQPATKPIAKVSLFHLDNAEDSNTPTSASAHNASFPHEDNDAALSPTDEVPALADPTFSLPQQHFNSAPDTHSQSLTDLAAHLPPSARRQLLGRAAQSSSSSTAAGPKVLTFSPSAEYRYNESVRHGDGNGDSAGLEIQQHRPVRGIAPGKHSLQQLVSNAATQRDALEEAFASGHRNRREAGGKYGW